MAIPRQEILKRLHAQGEAGKPIVGCGAGTGISAKFAERGGADLIIIYNSGRYRMAGRGSLAGMMPYGDANSIVVEMASEVLPVVEDVVGDEDLAALMDARYRPAEHVGWPRTLVGEEHGLPIWTIEHAGWNALLRAAFTLLLPLQCEGQAASLRVTQVKERYGRLVIHVRACDPFLPGLVRFFRAHSAKVCIRCGGRGTLRDGDDVGWVRPECDRCWSVRPARA